MRCNAAASDSADRSDGSDGSASSAGPHDRNGDTTVTLIDKPAPVPPGPRLGSLPVAVICAGPVGLATAANLVERGIDFRIYEGGPAVASAVAAWGHIRLFSPWAHLVDPVARRLLAPTGWIEPDAADLPTGAELISVYLERLAGLEAISSRIETGVTVEPVSRVGMDRTRTVGRSLAPFLLRMRPTDAGGGTGGGGPGGLAADTWEAIVSALIDASGTCRCPNGLAASGLDPLGLDEVAGAISSALPDVLGTERLRFAGRHATVVGAGHSAANALIALARLAGEEPGTRITWAIRNFGAVRVSSSRDGEPRAAVRL